MSQPEQLSEATLAAIKQEEEDPCPTYSLDDPNCPDDILELHAMAQKVNAKQQK